MGRKINKNRWLCVIAFFLFTGSVLWMAGRVVRAKFVGDSTTIVNGFYAEKRTDIDVIVIGSSNSFCTVNPLVLYENYGIAAYDFGSSSQPLQISALYLKEALRRQTPAVVALEVNMLVGGSVHDKDEEALRWGLTDIPLSIDKLRCIYQLLGRVDAEYFSYVFPVFRYHNRWKNLTKSDYTYVWEDKENPTKGYLETQAVAETAVGLSDYLIDGVAWIEQDSIAYLDEIAALCSDHGVELLLFKSPREDWHTYETEAVRALAQERDLQFVDYNELYHSGEIALDVTADFRDGQHLNDFGAEKVSQHFGAFLKEHYTLPDRREDAEQNSWDRACLYKERKGWQAYMGAENAHDCLTLLQDDSNYIIMVTENSGKGNKKHEQWVYQDGSVVFHKEWHGDGMEYLDIGTSQLVLSKQGIAYHVLIDDVEYYQMGNRWNIIVYDKVTQEVVGRTFPD